MARRLSSIAGLRFAALLEQSDLQVLRAIDNLAVHGKPPVDNAQHQLSTHHALDIGLINDFAGMRQHLPGKFQIAQAQRPAAALAADPAEVKTDHLPQRVQPKAARHDRVILEMAAEKPEVRFHVELGADQALAVLAAAVANLAD